MAITSYYPVLMTRNVAATASFYMRHFGFEALFTADWYVHLQSREAGAPVSLAILDARHETIPAAGRGAAGAGILLNFEVDDVDAEYARLTAAGLEVLLPVRDEAFGQRHFIVQAPDGVMVDVIKPIPPSGEFVQQYAEAALPG
ncbi:VOC family protein [Piscinibacter sp. HJYY11]|uniref:VOC family protein n=1 Tax=Piscinibacter sp. HJYY11 TaxID=2801333 RepID=UPI00191CE479|nr:VOC family protein [Piscinibacter sp. HJYY11]MBL0727478.1 VOC family protein [Piscinibacter sp. HJYY11]